MSNTRSFGCKKKGDASSLEVMVRESVIRRQTIHLIETKLRQLSAASKHKNNHEAALLSSRFASIIERNLYRQAPTFSMYADRKTLHTRVKIAAMKIMKRRIVSENKKDKFVRLSELKKILSKSIYDDIMNLKNEILTLRLQVSNRSATKSAVGVDDKKVSTSFPACSCSNEDGRVLPHPMRNLFFNVKLLNELEYASIERLGNLNWNQMINEAKNTIESYKSWKSTNSTSTTEPVKTSDSNTIFNAKSTTSWPNKSVSFPVRSEEMKTSKELTVVALPSSLPVIGPTRDARAA